MRKTFKAALVALGLVSLAALPQAKAEEFRITREQCLAIQKMTVNLLEARSALLQAEHDKSLMEITTFIKQKELEKRDPALKAELAKVFKAYAEVDKQYNSDTQKAGIEAFKQACPVAKLN